MLKRVKIQGYKSLVDVEVNLQPLCVLFGPNASGKSNFLDALQLLSRIVSVKTLKDAFDYPYRGTPLESFTFGPEGISGLMQREKVSFRIEVDVELSPTIVKLVNEELKQMEGAYVASNIYIKEEFLRYCVEVETVPKSGLLRIVSEDVTTIKGDNKAEKPQNFLAWHGSGKNLYLEGRRPYRLDYLDQSLLAKPLYPNQSPHLVALQREIASWLFFSLEPREHMRATTPVKEVRYIGLMGEELAAFFNTLRALNARQFDAIEKALHVMLPSTTGIDVSVNNIGNVELSLLEGQTPIPADILSDGTLRILGLLTLSGIKELPLLLGLEEPESGVAPDKLDLIALILTNLSDNRQVIATTHSPILLDFIPEKSLYLFKMDKGKTVVRALEYVSTSRRKKQTVSERLLRGHLYA